MNMRLARIGFVTMCLTSACMPSRNNSIAPDSRISASSSEMSLGQLISGLNTPFASPERKTVAEFLESRIEAYKSLARNGGDPTLQDDINRSLKVLSWTADYLKGTGCAQEDKIRLYRGFGTIPIYGPDARGKGVILPTPWSALVDGNLKSAGILFQPATLKAPTGPDGYPSLQGELRGDIAFRNRDKLSAPAFPESLFRSGFGIDIPMEKKDGFEGSRCFSCIDLKAGIPMNMGLLRLMVNHAVSSTNSLLISTTASSGLAAEFGPAYLTLDVCPQRAIYNVQSMWPTEQEFLMPLFILPEEIVSADGFSCSFLGTDKIEGHPSCMAERAEKRYGFDQFPANSLSATVRECLANTTFMVDNSYEMMSRLTASYYSILTSPVEKMASQLRTAMSPPQCPNACRTYWTKGVSGASIHASIVYPYTSESEVVLPNNTRLQATTGVEAGVMTAVIMEGAHKGKTVVIGTQYLDDRDCPFSGSASGGDG